MVFASNLLARSSAPMTRIAEAVGYQTDTAFSRAFRRDSASLRPHGAARGRRCGKPADGSSRQEPAQSDQGFFNFAATRR